MSITHKILQSPAVRRRVNIEVRSRLMRMEVNTTQLKINNHAQLSIVFILIPQHFKLKLEGRNRKSSTRSLERVKPTKTRKFLNTIG